MPSKEGEKITEGVNEVLSGMGMPEQETELTAIEEHQMFDGSTAVSWGIMVLFIAIFFAISVVALKFTTRRLKK